MGLVMTVPIIQEQQAYLPHVSANIDATVLLVIDIIISSREDRLGDCKRRNRRVDR